MVDRRDIDPLRRRILLAGAGLVALGGFVHGVGAAPVAGRNYTVLVITSYSIHYTKLYEIALAWNRNTRRHARCVANQR